MQLGARAVIVQTLVSSFRHRFFSELYDQARGSLEIWSGNEYFTPTAEGSVDSFPWSRRLRNRFLFGRRLLWQSGHFAAAYRAPVCVLEFNPRILSSWTILIMRRLTGRRTILWGHLASRAGARSPTMALRFAMLALAGGFIAYTYSEGDRLKSALKKINRLPGKSLFRNFSISIAPNSVSWKNEVGCKSVPHKRFHRILFVGRLVKEKKPMLLLESFNLALKDLPKDVVLDFIGTGPCAAVLHDRVRDLSLDGRVTLHGAIYDPNRLRQFFEDAIVVVSPGYVGLSATQSFGFGVPMLIAQNEPHSVEIELCRAGWNCDFFPSDSETALARNLTNFVISPPAWSQRRKAISEHIGSRYNLEAMCDGFMDNIAPFIDGLPRRGDSIHIAIAWMGLPYYAARVIGEAVRRHPSWQFTIISSRDSTPERDLSSVVGKEVIWVDAGKPLSWRQLSISPPDLLVFTSWAHVAFQMLAIEARNRRGTVVVSMVDNYLRYTLKQLVGFFYFRFFLRELYSAMWVPGEYSMRFMRFLGMRDDLVYSGLYAADNQVFRVPDAEMSLRSGVVFVGQLIERKGVRNLAAVASQFEQRGTRLNLKLFGDGPLKEELVSRGLDVGSFLGPAELAVVYNSADALILPSYIDHWGVVVHEAALCGCLLLVTRQCGCVHELVEDGVNGYVMKESSPAEILLALNWLRTRGPAEIERGRAESRRRAATISPEKWADTLDKIVDRFVLPNRSSVSS